MTISTFSPQGLASVTATHRDRLHAIPLLPKNAFLGFVLALVAVVVMAQVSYQSLEARSNSAELVKQTLRTNEVLQALLTLLVNAETSQRGFLLTGNENYLSVYATSRAELPGRIDALRQLLSDPEQLRRLSTMEILINQKMEELDQTIALRRSEKIEQAVAIVRTDRGKEMMDRIRVLASEMQTTVQTLLDERQKQWDKTSSSSVFITMTGSGVLLVLIACAAVMVSRDFRVRETQAWLRTGQMRFSESIQGDQRLESLGDSALEFLAKYLEARIGAAYVNDGTGNLRRIAGIADTAQNKISLGEGLLGQAVKENRVMHVRDVPTDYRQVNSTLGQSSPRELVIMPVSIDGRVQAAVELGFFRAIRAEDLELLERVSESLAVAVRTSKDRTRLEELLEETQRQSEELQTQQEELRTSNEELETQARALKDSQVQLQSQQAELEQINSQLEEQTQTLTRQKDELGQSQEILAQKAEELERTNQYKSEFLANMSHELRTPLNSSLILAKMLADNKDGNLSTEQVKYANTILGAGHDLLTIINDVLDLSKIEAGKVELNVESVEIARMLDSVSQSFQPIADQKKLSFEVVVEKGTPKNIETDTQRLSQILKNLLSNAFKFTDQGKVILRVFPYASAGVSFAVSDTGIGIPTHQQQMIFEAFRQADGSTHRKYGGTGLGLSISKDLAKRLGGDISVRSLPNDGSTFTLTLPIAFQRIENKSQSDSAAKIEDQIRIPKRNEFSRIPIKTHDGKAQNGIGNSEVADDRAQISADSKFVLVIEDDARFAAILRDLAHERGFQCVVTHTANDGLIAAQLMKPRAILLDINLPDHSGLGVLDQLKRNPKTRHIPVHVASVVDFTQEALGLGAVGYALKPVKRDELLEAFSRLEAKSVQHVKRVLLVEDDARQRDSVRALLAGDDVEIIDVAMANEAIMHLQTKTFDCMVMDINLPDLSGFGLLQKMASQEDIAFPPVIIYTGRSLTTEEEQQLRRFSKSIIIKDARSPERLLDEVTLFLHQVEDQMPLERQRMLKIARDRETVFEGRRILVVEDDVRNIFALTSLLEPKGAKIEIARNGKEALVALGNKHDADSAVDLVLMDIMMPEMDGLTAMREIRKTSTWKKLPIIALTAKAMRDDQEKCLAAGANDYIAKPLDVEKLLSLIRVWLPK